MSRKQKIIVSITGIILVSLILIGLTYAYFLTKISGNTNSKSISVTTANLVLEYGENTNVVQGINNAEPGYSVEKIFTATNKGNSDVTYGAALENIVNELSRQEDLVYTLTCTSYLKEGFSLASDGTITGTVDGTCNGVSTETKFPSTSNLSIMVNNTIDTIHTHTYKLTITYKEMNVDQSTDMNKTFSAKVNIVDLNAVAHNNPYKDNTSSLAYNIINNAMNKTNGTELVGTPKTIPAKETSDYKYYTGKVDEATSESSILIDATRQGYYWTYGTSYTIDENTGKFTLTGVSTCKYNDGTCNTTLGGKYLAFSSASSNSSRSDTKRTTTNLYEIYKVTEAPASSTSTITMKIKEISSIAYSTEKVLSITSDDHGTSYYYRGGVEDNYVNFARMCWRIVRIVGDGSVKLILEDQNKTCEDPNYTGNWNLGAANFGYDGSTYGIDKYIINYLNPKTNVSNALVNKFKTFQTGTLADRISEKYSNKNLSNYLKSGDWCYDDTAYISETSTNGIPLTEEEKINYYNGTASGYFYYDSYIRLERKNEKEPTNKCNGTVLSKFDDENNTSMYVATLTADELLFSGAANSINYTHYLINNYQKNNEDLFWSLSPSYYDGGYSYAILMTNVGDFGSDYLGFTIGSRPAIQLKSNVQISKGNGTKENPYEIAS